MIFEMFELLVFNFFFVQNAWVDTSSGQLRLCRGSSQSACVSALMFLDT